MLGGDGEDVQAITYEPAAKDYYLRCPNGSKQLPDATGLTRNRMGQTGHLRASIIGDGWFNAGRPKQKSRRRAGIDIAGVLNTTPVVAFLQGNITFAGHTPGEGGTLVIMNHGHGLTSGYVHLQPGSIPAAGDSW